MYYKLYILYYILLYIIYSLGMGRIYLKGIHPVKQDGLKALKCFEQGIEKS